MTGERGSKHAGRRGRLETSGTMRGYYREGKTYRPSMSAYESVRANDWMVQDFPDLLWPVALVVEHGADGAVEFGNLQDRYLSRLSAVGRTPEPMRGLDGRLTSLEALDEIEREALRNAIDDGAPGWVLPTSLLAAIRNYSELPGAWLLSDSVPHEGSAEPADLALLADALVDVMSDRHHKALVTSVPYGWLLRCGLIKLGDHEIHLLVNYPNDPTTVKAADAFILSAHLALKAALEDQETEATESRRRWSDSFWTQNSTLLACMPEESEASTTGFGSGDDAQMSFEGDTDADESVGADDPLGAEAALTAFGLASGDVGRVSGSVAAAFDAFLDRSLPPANPINLAQPAKFEVVVGLVSRACRTALALAYSPHMWSGEHGMGALRSIVETRIVLAWMRVQDGEVYSRYQSYGRGKRQLMSLKFDELAEYFGDDVPPFLAEAREDFKRKLGSDWSQQFQDVSIDSTFAGKSVRQMADEADLLDLYRHMYQSASGVSHGEWWAVEDYAMQRCLNPLHAFHALPSFDPMFPPTPAFANVLVAQLEDLIDEAALALGLA